jgi:hypothetical protein
LHTKNEELHVKTTENTPLGGGDNSVIIANSTNAQAANDPHPKGEVKPVIQKTVRQSLAAQIEPLKKDSSTTDLSHQLTGQVKQGGDIHLVERLTPLGEVKPVIPPQFEENPNSFTPTVETYSQMGNGQRYTTDEVLTDYEKPLFNHLLACPYCHVLRKRNTVSMAMRWGVCTMRYCSTVTMHRQGVSHWPCVWIERVYQAVACLCRLVALMHHRHPIPRYKRDNMATLTNMRRLSITGQLAKCVSLILVDIAVRGKG